MQKKGAKSKAPHIVVVLAIFLVVLSVVGIIMVNDRINTKINYLSSGSAETNGQARISLDIEPAPNTNAEVSVDIEKSPKNK